MHYFNPSFLALSIKLVQSPIFDKDFITLTPPTQPGALQATLLEFETDTGILPVQNTFEGQTFGGPKTLKTLFLQCHPEILSYSASPFQIWKLLSASKGKIVFQEDILQTLLSLPHPIFHHRPSRPYHPSFNTTLPTDFRHVQWNDGRHGNRHENDDRPGHQEALQNTQNYFRYVPDRRPTSNNGHYRHPPPNLAPGMQIGASPPLRSRNQNTRPATRFQTPQEINHQNPINHQNLSHSNMRESDESFGILRQWTGYPRHMDHMDDSIETRVRNPHLNSTFVDPDPSHNSNASLQPDVSPILSPTNEVTTASQVLQYSPPIPGIPSIPQPSTHSSPTTMITTVATTTSATSATHAIRTPVVTTEILSSIATPVNYNMPMLDATASNPHPLTFPSTDNIIQNVTSTPRLANQVLMSIQNNVATSQEIYNLRPHNLRPRPPAANMIYSRAIPPTTAEENVSQHQATPSISAMAKDLVSNIRTTLSRSRSQ